MDEKILKVKDGTKVITKSQYSGKDYTAVILPNSVKIIDDFAFKDCKNLKKINFPSGLVFIGIGAFFRCTSLTKIVLPDTLKTIEFAAFKKSGIESLTIPKSVVEIGDCSFKNSSLKEITILSNAKKMGEEIFSGCFDLTYVKILGCIKSISASMFSHTSIKEISIPDSVIKIEDAAFDGCSELNVNHWSKNLKSIGENAFRGTAIDNLVLFENVTKVASSAFFQCDNLEKIELNSSSTSISYKDGVLLNENGQLVYNTNKKVIRFPKGQKEVLEIPNCKTVEEIYISDEIRKIDVYSLSQCKNLRFLSVDKGNKKFTTDEYGILYNKEKTMVVFAPPMIKELAEYVVPKTVKRIGEFAFYGNKNIKSIKIYEKVEVDKYAFSGSSFLETVDNVSYADTVVYSASAEDGDGIIKFREGTICCAKYWNDDYWFVEEILEDTHMDHNYDTPFGSFQTGIEELWIPSSMRSLDTTSLKYHFEFSGGLKKILFIKNGDVYKLNDTIYFDPTYYIELQKNIFSFMNESDLEEAKKIWKKNKLQKYLTKV